MGSLKGGEGPIGRPSCTLQCVRRNRLWERQPGGGSATSSPGVSRSLIMSCPTAGILGAALHRRGTCGERLRLPALLGDIGFVSAWQR